MKAKRNSLIGQIGLLVVMMALWGMTVGCSSGRRTPRPGTGPAPALTPATGTAPPIVIAPADQPTSTAAATADYGDTPAPAAMDGVRVRPRLNTVNIRRGPGTQFEIAGLLRRDETARALGRDPASTWFNVVTDAGLNGWVAANVVEFVAGAADALDVMTAGPAVAATATNAPPADDGQPQPPGPTITINPVLTPTPTTSLPLAKTTEPYPQPTAPVTPNPYP